MGRGYIRLTPRLTKLLDLPEDLLHEIFSRLPFADKQRKLPLVCKHINAVLLCTSRPGLWGPLTLDFQKFKRQSGASRFRDYNYLEDDRVLRSLLWIANRCSAFELVRIIAFVSSRVEATYLLRALNTLTSNFASAQRLPALELQLRGSFSARFLDPTVVSGPHWTSYVLPNLTYLEVRDVDGLAAVHMNQLAGLVGLEKLSIGHTDREAVPVTFVQSLSALSRLKSLHVHGSTMLSGLIAASGDWFQLTKLSVTGPMPGDLDGVHLHTHLLTFSFRNCWLDKLPESLCTLSQLQQLDLRDNSLRLLPDAVSGIIGLRVLNLKRNSFMVFPDSPLAALTSLEHLDISRQEAVREDFPADTAMAVLAPITCFWAMPCLKRVDLRQEGGYDMDSERWLNSVVHQLRLASVRCERACRPVVYYHVFDLYNGDDSDI